MITLKSKIDCCGCNACGDVCHVNAITFQTDNEGFWYPVTDTNVCDNCHACEKVCPIINIDKLKHNDFEEPKVYGCFNKDIVIRFDSTSGGIFSVLAQHMYSQKGYVGGAIYTENFDVKNIISNDKQDLKRLRSSKYVQSNAEGLYRQVRDLLRAGERVLVCGAPCQMAGLRAFLHHDYDNLIIVDFLCRACNSPKVFHKYLDALEAKYGSKIVKIKDKNKDHGWHSLARKITFEDGQVYYGESHEDDYRRGYHMNVYERPSCYECKFKGFPRMSDITLADFWGLQQIDPEMDRNLGTSLVLINSEKGAKYFDEIKGKLELKEYTLSQAAAGNRPAMLDSHLDYPASINREDFFKALDEKPFDQVAAEFFPFQAPNNNSWKRQVKNVLSIVKRYRKNPVQLWRIFRWNFLSKQIVSDLRKRQYFNPQSHCAIDIAKTAKVV